MHGKAIAVGERHDAGSWVVVDREREVGKVIGVEEYHEVAMVGYLFDPAGILLLRN